MGKIDVNDLLNQVDAPECQLFPIPKRPGWGLWISRLAGARYSFLDVLPIYSNRESLSSVAKIIDWKLDARDGVKIA